MLVIEVGCEEHILRKHKLDKAQEEESVWGRCQGSMLILWLRGSQALGTSAMEACFPTPDSCTYQLGWDYAEVFDNSAHSVGVTYRSLSTPANAYADTVVKLW